MHASRCICLSLHPCTIPAHAVHPCTGAHHPPAILPALPSSLPSSLPSLLLPLQAAPAFGAPLRLPAGGPSLPQGNLLFSAAEGVLSQSGTIAQTAETAAAAVAAVLAGQPPPAALAVALQHAQARAVQAQQLASAIVGKLAGDDAQAAQAAELQAPLHTAPQLEPLNLNPPRHKVRALLHSSWAALIASEKLHTLLEPYPLPAVARQAAAAAGGAIEAVEHAAEASLEAVGQDQQRAVALGQSAWSRLLRGGEQAHGVLPPMLRSWLPAADAGQPAVAAVAAAPDPARPAAAAVGSPRPAAAAATPPAAKSPRTGSTAGLAAKAAVAAEASDASKPSPRSSARQGSGARHALLSPMPPAQTGVAIANLHTCLEADLEVDIFSQWQDSTQFAAFSRLGQPRQAGYHARLLAPIAARRRYDKLVVSVGNSTHNFFIQRSLAQPRTRALFKRLALHLHDPAPWNLVVESVGRSVPALRARLLAAYGAPRLAPLLPLFDQYRTPEPLVAPLMEAGICFARPLIEDLRPDEVIVNSAHAARMVLAEFDGQLPFTLVHGFHPVFAADVRRSTPPASNGASARIGSFGIPDQSKGTPLVAQACRLLQESGTSVTLVIAGFGAAAYQKRHAAMFDGVQTEWHDSPDEARLLALMDGVHLAVQLRPGNQGESSGVVASLIAKACPLIVTGKGSFLEYRNIAHLLPPQAGPAELAEAIREQLAQPERHAAGARDYARLHSAAALARLWFG